MLQTHQVLQTCPLKDAVAAHPHGLCSAPAGSCCAAFPRVKDVLQQHLLSQRCPGNISAPSAQSPGPVTPRKHLQMKLEWVWSV